LIDHYDPLILGAQDYYPFGMLSRVAVPNDDPLFRYGFNNKENNDDVSGLGNMQNYGMREYDTRIGRFWSVDPLAKKYPWYAPYQFAGNKPIYAVDLDGAEELSHMSQFSYDGSWGGFDWAKAIPNAVGRLWNGAVVDTWNSGVTNVRGVQKGTWARDVSNESRAIGQGIKNYVVEGYKYHSQTPISQQAQDAKDYFTSPKALEDVLVTGANIYVGNKLLGSQGNLLKPSAITIPTADEIFSGGGIATRSLAEKYALSTPEYRSFLNANEVIMPNNPGYDLINTIEKKVVQVTTTNADKLNPGQFYKKIRDVVAHTPKNFEGVLQIYIREGRYSQEQTGTLLKKLQQYINDNNFKVQARIKSIK
jgi:RHS repeat-associated protein